MRGEAAIAAAMLTLVAAAMLTLVVAAAMLTLVVAATAGLVELLTAAQVWLPSGKCEVSQGQQRSARSAWVSQQTKPAQ